MAREREGPWFNATKNTWYYTDGGRNKSLRIRGVRNERAAWTAFELAVNGKSPHPLSALAPDFLSEAAGRLKANTVRIYSGDLGKFLGTFGDQSPDDVKPLDIHRWLLGLAVSQTTRGMTLRSVGAFFGWMVKNDLVANNPVRKVAKPRGRKRGREAVLKPGVYEALLGAASREFAAVLRFLRATGCRPGEVSQVNSASYDPAARVVVIGEHKTDRDGHDRTIFLDGETAAVVEGLIARFPAGPIFHTYKGTVWTGRAITEAMRSTRGRAKVKARAYDLRHTYITEALLGGESDTIVAALVGHATTSTIHSNYNHVTTRSRELGEVAEKLARKRAG